MYHFISVIQPVEYNQFNENQRKTSYFQIRECSGNRTFKFSRAHIEIIAP